MAWDAWWLGDLTFPSRGVERWKKRRTSPSSWTALPRWLTPTFGADGPVASVLAMHKAWATSLRRSVNAPDAVSTTASPTSVALRGYATHPWFAHVAGGAVALTIEAAREGARGQLLVADVRTARGHRFVVGGGRVEIHTVDLVNDRDVEAEVEDARAWLEGRAEITPPDLRAPQPRRAWADIAGAVGGRLVDDPDRPHPFADVLREAGAIVDAPEDRVAKHFAEGADRELACAQRRCAVFDLSLRTSLRLSHHTPAELLSALSGSTGDAVGELDLVDPVSGRFVDRVLATPLFGASRQLFGSPIDRPRLHDWLAMQALATKRPASTVTMPLLFEGPMLAFVGPDAVATARDLLRAPSLGALAEGATTTEAADATWIARGTRHDLPCVWATLPRDRASAIASRARSLFAGREAEDALDRIAARPARPRWSSAHQPPWTERATHMLAMHDTP